MKRLLSLMAFCAAVVSAWSADVRRIEPKEAAELVKSGKAVLVDVREPSEWGATGVVTGAVLLPKSDFDGGQALWKPFLEKVGDKQVILYCRSGRRAGVVGAALAEKGYQVANAGGLEDWRKAGQPVKKVEEKK